MNVAVFDTETIGLNKPFCYNVGMIIADTDSGAILKKYEWIIEQIWHNLPLFETAYYADKRPIYVKRMKARKIKMKKWEQVTQEMRKIFKQYKVTAAYAYNSQFDEKVFNFNCNWFKTQNPFENLPVYDIRGYAHSKICTTEKYMDFCDMNNRLTKFGNYSTTAESVFQYLSENASFKEEHTALADSVIEWDILKHCIARGCKWNMNYETLVSIQNRHEKTFILTLPNGDNYEYKYRSLIFRKAERRLTLK